MQTLKPCPFCNGSAEIVQDSGNFFARCENSACPPAPQTPLVDDADTAVNDWNTRPAAPVEGLDTVNPIYISSSHICLPKGDYVTRSQAEAIIAAKEAERAEQWRLRREMEADRDTKKAIATSLETELATERAESERLRTYILRAEKAEADNAAQAARVKEWEKADRLVAAALWEGKVKALETQLAAAEKALGIIFKNTRDETAILAARAALEVKP